MTKNQLFLRTHDSISTKTQGIKGNIIFFPERQCMLLKEGLQHQTVYKHYHGFSGCRVVSFCLATNIMTGMKQVCVTVVYEYNDKNRKRVFI